MYISAINSAITFGGIVIPSSIQSTTVPVRELRAKFKINLLGSSCVYCSFATGTFFASSFLIFVIMISHRDNKLGRASINVFSIFITLGIIVTIAWASHASAVNITLGMISDSIHLIAVSIWVGVVLVVAWFSTNTENWDKFLSWFSIVAISCLGATAISGFLLLEVLVEDYVDSWLVSYGQGLFLKHLFIFKFINSESVKVN